MLMIVKQNKMTKPRVYAISTFGLLALAIAGVSLNACGKAESTSEPAGNGANSDSDFVAGAAGELRTIMVALGDDMGQLHSALWLEDFDLIVSGAMKVADHPKVSDSEKTRIVKSLGSEFGAFVALDKAVHADALALSEAATAKDLPKVLEGLAQLQGSCVACHTQFRSRLVSE